MSSIVYNIVLFITALLSFDFNHVAGQDLFTNSTNSTNTTDIHEICYIVMFQDDDCYNNFLNTYNGTVLDKLPTLRTVLTALVNETEIEELEFVEGVELVRKDVLHEIEFGPGPEDDIEEEEVRRDLHEEGSHYNRYLEETVPWSIAAMNATAVSDEYISNQRVCLFATGYDFDHEDLPKDNVTGFNVDGQGTWQHDIAPLGQGTYNAGLMVALGGNDKGARGVIGNGNLNLHIAKVFDDSNGGGLWSSGFLRALESCKSVNSNIVAMPMVFPPDGAVTTAINRYYTEQNMLFIGESINGRYPGQLDSVIAVTGVEVDGSKSYNDDPRFVKADVSAPCHNLRRYPGKPPIISTLKDGSYGYPGTSNSMVVFHASTNAAALIALVWSHYPEKSNLAIRNAIEQSTIDISEMSGRRNLEEERVKDNVYGTGLVQAYSAFEYFIRTQEPSTVPSAEPSTSKLPSLEPSDEPSFVPSLRPSISLRPSTSPVLPPSSPVSNDPLQPTPPPNPFGITPVTLPPVFNPFDPPDAADPICSLGGQSAYCYDLTQSASDAGTPVCDWNITLVDPLVIMQNTSQGAFLLCTNYTLEDHHYDVEVFEKDCLTVPSGPTNFPLVFGGAVNTVDEDARINDVELGFIYNQTLIEESSLWTATKTGGYAQFCIRVNNYLDNSHLNQAYDPFDLEINFLEVIYRINVDSMTDFENTIDVSRVGADDGGVKEINYEEDIVAYICNETFDQITATYTQGSFAEICVQTTLGSRFGVHSIKDLTVSQWNVMDLTPYQFSEFDYVNNFLDSPLTDTECINGNTTTAICKAKIQLLSSWFTEEQISQSNETLTVEGTVKLDYVGRRLDSTVEVPFVSRMRKPTLESDGMSRALSMDSSDDSSRDFSILMHVTADDDAMSMASILGGALTSGIAFVAGLLALA